MTLYELFDISQGISDRIDVQWGFFITVHMALFGGIVYVDRPLKLAEKWVAMLLYLGFSAVNYYQLHNQFSLLVSAFQDVHAMAADYPSLALVDHYEKLRLSRAYKYVNPILAGVHIVMAFIVLGSVVYDKKDESIGEEAD